jgi:hypothetical protein
MTAETQKQSALYPDGPSQCLRCFLDSRQNFTPHGQKLGRMDGVTAQQFQLSLPVAQLLEKLPAQIAFQKVIRNDTIFGIGKVTFDMQGEEFL